MTLVTIVFAAIGACVGGMIGSAVGPVGSAADGFIGRAIGTIIIGLYGYSIMRSGTRSDSSYYYKKNISITIKVYYWEKVKANYA